MKRPTAQHGGARMKCNGDSLSLPLSLSYSCIYVLDSQPTVAWPPTTVAWPFSDFFQKNFKLLETFKNVVWQSADGCVTSDYCRVIVQWLFSKKFQIAWNIQETLFDGRVTVAWPPTTVAWPLSNGFTYASVCCLSRLYLSLLFPFFVNPCPRLSYCMYVFLKRKSNFGFKLKKLVDKWWEKSP